MIALHSKARWLRARSSNLHRPMAGSVAERCLSVLRRVAPVVALAPTGGSWM